MITIDDVSRAVTTDIIMWPSAYPLAHQLLWTVLAEAGFDLEYGVMGMAMRVDGRIPVHIGGWTSNDQHLLALLRGLAQHDNVVGQVVVTDQPRHAALLPELAELTSDALTVVLLPGQKAAQ